MIEECKAFGVPAPRFEQYSGGFAVVFKFVEPIGGDVAKQINKIKLTSRQESILAIIKRLGAVNLKTIQSELVNPPSVRSIQADLNHLKQAGAIELKGRTNLAEWVAKK